MVITSTQKTTTNDIVNKYILAYMLGQNENLNTIIDSILCVKEILLKIKENNETIQQDFTSILADTSSTISNIDTYIENVNSSLNNCETLSKTLAVMKSKTSYICTSSNKGTCFTKNDTEIINVLNCATN